MTLRDDLIAAKGLIDTPEPPTGANIDRAVQHACDHTYDRYMEATETLHFALPRDFAFVDEFEDHEHTTHADIMALFDRAIAAAESAS